MHLCVHLLLSKKKRIATGCLSLHKHLKALGNCRIIDAQSSGQAKSERIRFQFCHGWQNLKARFIPVRAKEPLPHMQLSFPKVQKRAAFARQPGLACQQAPARFGQVHRQSQQVMNSRQKHQVGEARFRISC